MPGAFCAVRPAGTTLECPGHRCLHEPAIREFPLNSKFGSPITCSGSEVDLFRLLLIAVLCFAAWKSYEVYATRKTARAAAEVPFELPAKPEDAAASYTCDKRKYCSQMTSCAEATWFLKNCPGEDGRQ